MKRAEANKSFELSIKFSLDDKLPGGETCPAPTSMERSTQMVLSSDTRTSDSFSISQEVTFSISNAKGQDPVLDVGKLLEMTECPSPLGTIGILGSQDQDDHLTERKCPILENPPPPTKKCVVRVDNHVRDAVSKAIRKTSRSSRSRQTQVTGKQETEAHTFASGAAVMAAVTGTIFGTLGLLLSLWTIYVGDVILLEIA